MNRLREIRKSRNMTMKQLGEIVGVSESTISFYETGRHEPDLDTLKRIADLFDTTIDYIVGRDVYLSSKESNDVAELVSLFFVLNEDGKETVMNTIRALAAYPDMKEETKHAV